MIRELKTVGINVLDVDEAVEFYTKKLGFVIDTDARMGDLRWVTLSLPGNPGLEFGLWPAGAPRLDEDSAGQLAALLAKGALTVGILGTDDCRATYEELRDRGVEFSQEPQENFYGTDAVFRDNSGNAWRLVQRPAEPVREFPSA
jgi:catechol 2,3-dioxygenase-like lactoylglutathione lyase family enzyme